MRDAHQIAGDLREIAALLALSKDAAHRFKARAYEHGASLVQGLGEYLGELIASGHLIEVKGIGPSLSKEVAEVWHTGCSSLLQSLRSRYPTGTGQLAQIPGLTARRIGILQERLNVTSVAMLEELCKQQALRDLPGLGARVEERVLLGIEASRKVQRGALKLRLADALLLAERLVSELTEKLNGGEVSLAGAVRRRDELTGNIELAVIGLPEEVVLSALAELPSVIYVDRERRLARLSEGLGLSVCITAREEAGTQLLFATATREHIDQLEQRATARGLRLARDGLREGDVRLTESASESSVYSALGLPYVPAELRGPWQPQAELLERDSFADLLSECDVRGAVHCHTTHSDGKHSIEEMARAAEELGFEYITITDHSPAAHYAGGVTLDRLERQWEEIAEVQQRVKIKILRGTESDILADGALDYPANVLEKFDLVIASIHTRHGLGRREMTERLVHAMKLPIFKIWGHALGRLLLEREPFDCDVEAVLDALAGSRGAVELNGDPYRLDLPSEWIPHARRRGIPFVVSLDAHSTQGLRVLRYAVMLARRGGLRRDEVLNTLPAAEFLAQVRPSAM